AGSHRTPQGVEHHRRFRVGAGGLDQDAAPPVARVRRGARALPRLLHGRQPGHDDEPAVTTLEGVDLDLWPSGDGPAHGEGSVEQPLHEGEGGERRLRATIRPEQTQVTIVDVADDLPGWRKILELVP